MLWKVFEGLTEIWSSRSWWCPQSTKCNKRQPRRSWPRNTAWGHIRRWSGLRECLKTVRGIWTGWAIRMTSWRGRWISWSREWLVSNEPTTLWKLKMLKWKCSYFQKNSWFSSAIDSKRNCISQWDHNTGRATSSTRRSKGSKLKFNISSRSPDIVTQEARHSIWGMATLLTREFNSWGDNCMKKGR